MKHHVRNWTAPVLWFVGVILVLATLIPIINSNFWWVRNLTFPQVQITVAIVVVLVLTVILLDVGRIGTRLLAGSLIAAIGYQLFYLLPYAPLGGTTVASASQCRPDDRIRLLELNVRSQQPASSAGSFARPGCRSRPVFRGGNRYALAARAKASACALPVRRCGAAG